MSVEALTWPGAPTSTDLVDGADLYAMGVEFTVTEDQPVPGIRWRVPDTAPPPAGGHFVSLWRVTGGTRLAHKAITPTPGGEQDFLFDAPVTVTVAGGSYVAQVYTSHYVHRAGAFPVSTPSGKAVASIGKLTSNSGPDVMAAGNQNAIYHVSPLFGTVDPDAFSVSGALSMPALTLTGALSVVRNTVSGALALPRLTLTGALSVSGNEHGEPAHGFPLRSDLAQALSTVAGVNGYLKKPAALATGDGWPRVTGLQHVAPGAWETSWQVVIILPDDEVARDEWLIARYDAVIDALAPLVWGADAEIGAVNDRPALLINCRE